MRRLNSQIAIYTNSTTYGHKLAKDNKKDANETDKKYTKIKTKEEQNMVGKLIYTV